MVVYKLLLLYPPKYSLSLYPQFALRPLYNGAIEPERITELRDEHDHHTYLLHEVIGLRAVADMSNREAESTVPLENLPSLK